MPRKIFMGPMQIIHKVDLMSIIIFIIRFIAALATPQGMRAQNIMKKMLSPCVPGCSILY